MLKKPIILFLLICSYLSIFPCCVTAEETGGIGLEILQLYHHDSKDRKGPIAVINVLPSGPAAAAGVEKGDIITRINDQSVAGNDFFYILEEMLRGPVHSNITLTINRTSTSQNFNLSLERINIKGLY